MSYPPNQGSPGLPANMLPAHAPHRELGVGVPGPGGEWQRAIGGICDVSVCSAVALWHFSELLCSVCMLGLDGACLFGRCALGCVWVLYFCE